MINIAVKVPETLAHLHYWSVELTRAASKEEVLAAFRTSSRIALMRYAGRAAGTQCGEGADGRRRPAARRPLRGRPMGGHAEGAGERALYAYMVDNQAIVVPETIDAIRALTKVEGDAKASIAETDTSLGIVGIRW